MLWYRSHFGSSDARALSVLLCLSLSLSLSLLFHLISTRAPLAVPDRTLAAHRSGKHGGGESDVGSTGFPLQVSWLPEASLSEEEVDAEISALEKRLDAALVVLVFSPFHC